jgi:hypothetical protein
VSRGSTRTLKPSQRLGDDRLARSVATILEVPILRLSRQNRNCSIFATRSGGASGEVFPRIAYLEDGRPVDPRPSDFRPPRQIMDP